MPLCASDFAWQPLRAWSLGHSRRQAVICSVRAASNSGMAFASASRWPTIRARSGTVRSRLDANAPTAAFAASRCRTAPAASCSKSCIARSRSDAVSPSRERIIVPSLADRIPHPWLGCNIAGQKQRLHVVSILLGGCLQRTLQVTGVAVQHQDEVLQLAELAQRPHVAGKLVPPRISADDHVLVAQPQPDVQHVQHAADDAFCNLILTEH